MIVLLTSVQSALSGQGTLVLQTDFGIADGAVAAMKGVARGVSSEIEIFDLTHEIPPFNVWEAAYRLYQTAPYWPPGTVFVSVVDPGVGTDRKSVVMQSESGHFFVTPDNGTLTLVADLLGVAEVREIDETRNRRSGSEGSHTFHGRDVYAFTGARLAAGVITFEQVGPPLQGEIRRLDYQRPGFQNGVVSGAIPILDVRYGNVWTNIDREMFGKLCAMIGDSISVRIFEGNHLIMERAISFERTFDDVPEGQPLVYFNSLGRIALALNRGNFASKYNVSSGAEWRVELSIPSK